MKALLCLALLLCVGCTSTSFKSPNGVEVKRASFLTKTGIGKVTISERGAVSMSAYQQTGDVEMLATIVAAAVEAAAKGAKP